MVEEWQRLCASPSGSGNYAEGGVMDIQKEREAFEAWAKISIENFVDLEHYGKFYVVQENSRLTIRKREFLLLAANRGWKAWKERAKLQTVPEGFVLVPKSDLESWHLWDGDSENMYRDNYSESICDNVELGAVFEIDVKMAFKVPLIYVVPIYSDSDDYEYEEFESEELAQKAAAENKTMIEAQEQSHDS